MARRPSLEACGLWRRLRPKAASFEAPRGHQQKQIARLRCALACRKMGPDILANATASFSLEPGETAPES